MLGVSYGLGAHVDLVPEEDRHKALVFKWAGQVAYIVVSTIVKFVVGIFLLRLCVNNNWQRLTIIVLLCVVGLFNAFYVFVAIFQCQPVAYYWYRYTKNAPVTGKCNGHALATIPTYFAVLIGLISDLTLALLPATLIKGANLDKKTKISVCCVLALGSLYVASLLCCCPAYTCRGSGPHLPMGFSASFTSQDALGENTILAVDMVPVSNIARGYRASVATIARVPYASQLLSNPDYLYNFTDLAMWSIVECGIAITASSLATLRPLFIQMKLLASSHFTSRYGHSFASGGLPIQSANSITVISSRGRSTKRNTGMTGSTAVSGNFSQSGGLKSVKEEQQAIRVEKEFEMSVMTKVDSFDSIDRLEAEVNEVITPGRTAATRNLSHERMSSTPRSDSFSSRRRPPPLQTTFEAPPASTEDTSSASPSIAGHRFAAEASCSTPSSPWMGRRPSDGAILNSTPHNNVTISSARHQSSLSESSVRTNGVTFSPPGFHLPSRLQHQSIASGHSSRGTLQGLSAPPRVTQTSYGGYAPSNVPSPSLGSPISMSERPDWGMSSPPKPQTAPGSPSWQPFPGQASTQATPERTLPGRRGKPRVSAFSPEPGESSALSTDDREEALGRRLESPQWVRPSPASHSVPSPLRSHPPRISGNWV